MSSGYVEEVDQARSGDVLSVAEVAREARMPQVSGLDWGIWLKLINSAVLLAQAGATVSLDGVKDLCPEVPVDVINRVFASNNYARALEMRGVIDEKSTVGLTEKQMLALNLITNFTDTRKLSMKLKSIGVSESEFNTWTRGHKRFKTIYRRLSENLFDDAQAAVNTTLVQKAVDGEDIRWTKLFNEMSGRWDPATRQQTDVRQVLQAVIEILTSTIKDPELLREIGGKMQMLMIGTSPVEVVESDGADDNTNEYSAGRQLTSLNLFG